MGHKSSTKTVVEKQDTQQHSWVMDIPGLKELGESAVKNGTTIPDYVKVGMSQQQLDTLNQIYQGQDYSGMKEGSDFFQNIAKGLTSEGEDYVGRGLNTIERITNMSPDDYNDLIDKYTDSDLVKRQEAQSTSDLNEQYQANVQSLNQRATSAGAMGSSRAGVAQGVMAGKTQENIGRANLAIESAAREDALGMVKYQIGNQQSAANTYLQYGQNAYQTGLGAMNTGLNWGAQYNQGQMSNLNNKYMVGTIQQQEAQNQADVDRINQMMRDNPDLYRWMQMTGAMAPAAGWSSSGTTNTNSKTTTTSPGGGFGAVLGIAGAAVGGFFGGPAGAMAGASIGSAAGNAM